MTTMNLRGNEITDTGAIALASALEKSPSMTTLDLSCNQITDAGAIALASAVKKNRSMTNLNLSENWITDAGAIALASAVEKSWHMDYVNVDGPRIGDGRLFIRDALARAATLRQLLALLSAVVPGRVNARVPAATLVWRDGDHAVAHRVLRFMLEMSAA